MNISLIEKRVVPMRKWTLRIASSQGMDETRQKKFKTPSDENRSSISVSDYFEIKFSQKHYIIIKYRTHV